MAQSCEGLPESSDLHQLNFNKNWEYVSKASNRPSESQEGHIQLPQASEGLLEALEMHFQFEQETNMFLRPCGAFRGSGIPCMAFLDLRHAPPDAPRCDARGNCPHPP